MSCTADAKRGESSERIVKRFEEFFHAFYKEELLRIVREGGRSIIVDFRELERFDIEMADGLLNRPRDMIAFAEEAVRRLGPGDGQVELNVRFHGLPESQNMKISDLRSEHQSRLVCIEGLIRRMSDVRPEVLEATFECPSCGSTAVLTQRGPAFREPSGCDCGHNGRLRIIDEKYSDMQLLELEAPRRYGRESDHWKGIKAFLRDDLIDLARENNMVPGTVVLVTGILGNTKAMTPGGALARQLDIFLDASHLEPRTAGPDDIEITPEDEQEIRTLAADPHIYRRLRESIAPLVYGHDTIKEALVLFLFGGVRRVHEDGLVKRGDIHILLIGDPGVGKSTLLKCVKKLALKARYVTGKGATGAGLTAAVDRDETTGTWVLEAGTLPLSSGGIVCIDRLEAMDDGEQDAMDEAMGQQTVTIGKGGIRATLTTQVAVLAAARPRWGRFDPYQPPADQINLSPVLLNRFDLIFPLRDKPDKEKDRRMADDVLRLHASETPQADQPINQDLLRKYIAFARKSSRPRLSEAAIQKITNFFVGLRDQYSQKDRSVPVSVRQLESMVRLAEASARVRLADKAEPEDAHRAIRLVFEYLKEVGYDPETGKLDIDRASGTMPASKRNQLTEVLEIIRTLEGPESTDVKLDDVLREAEARGMDVLVIEKSLRELMQMGEIFESRRGFVKRL